jgi:hypothetical protein|tara:strand:- start:407 stop:640 length:234 start_codon:yes stop_codon:yes gene_type:complete
MTEKTEIEEATLSINLSAQQALMLIQLLKTSRDDPRIHGLIGTCFWFHSHDKDQEQEVKENWTAVLEKLEGLKLNGE